MKDVHLKKIDQIYNFSVYLVDGKLIRKSMDIDFTNIGQHYKFSFIPENEFWIDVDVPYNEIHFFIDHLLIENRLMKSGVDYDTALNYAYAVQRSERKRDEVHRIALHKMPISTQHVVDKLYVHIEQPKIDVYFVNGEIVRNDFDIDFREGGHDLVYHYIPSNQIWIEKSNQEEALYLLVHEFCERHFMSQGLDYQSAHKKASELEFFIRNVF